MSRTGGLKYIQLWPADVIAHLHRTGETAEEFGARVILWCVSADELTPGTLPNCEKSLARMSMLGLKRWRKVKSAVLEGWTLNPETNRWEIRRIMDQASRMQELSTKRAEAGRKGGMQASAKQLLSNSFSREQAIAKQKGKQTDQASSSSSSSSSSYTKKPPIVPHGGTRKRARSKRPKTNSKEYSPDFLTIWEPYPNGTAKREAFDEWLKVQAQDGRHAGLPVPTVAVILQAIDWKMRSPGWAKDDYQYVEQLQRFLRRRRWEDEPDGDVRPRPIEQFEREAANAQAEG